MMIRNPDGSLPPETAKLMMSWYGDGNNPPNLRDCTEADYWGYRSSYSFNGEAYVGYTKLPDGSAATRLVFFISNGRDQQGGFVVDRIYSGQLNGKVIYRRWGLCIHTFEEKRLGNCYHGYTCTKCDARYTVDSSD